MFTPLQLCRILNCFRTDVNFNFICFVQMGSVNNNTNVVLLTGLSEPRGISAQIERGGWNKVMNMQKYQQSQLYNITLQHTTQHNITYTVTQTAHHSTPQYNNHVPALLSSPLHSHILMSSCLPLCVSQPSRLLLHHHLRGGRLRSPSLALHRHCRDPCCGGGRGNQPPQVAEKTNSGEN
jgi:hypothetical protein